MYKHTEKHFILNHRFVNVLVILTLWLSQGLSQERPNIIFIITDDHGYADLGAYQDAAEDIRTPNLDKLACEGALMTNGYVTAPQCVPSRAGVITGRYQSRFNLEENRNKPLSLNEATVADHLKAAGYMTGFVGKWHLNPDRSSKTWIQSMKSKADGKAPFLASALILPYRPVSRGFSHAFEGVMSHYFTNYDLDGNVFAKPKGYGNKDDFRIDIQTEAALSFLDLKDEKPFFLYLSYYAPHVPCEVTEKYFSRFPETMPKRRKWALASIAAVDDGVGRIVASLKDKGQYENTIFFFFGDNGAPLKIDKHDAPFKERGWCGSVNGDMVGEKGMLSDGGIRVPFFVHWKGRIPAQRYQKPVISLDATATAIALSESSLKNKALDGVNLMPFLTGDSTGEPHEALFWRWGAQSAIRMGKWKLHELAEGTRMLFDMESDKHEHNDLLKSHPEVVSSLAPLLKTWRGELNPPGFARGINPVDLKYYKHYFDQDLSVELSDLKRNR